MGTAMGGGGSEHVRLASLRSLDAVLPDTDPVLQNLVESVREAFGTGLCAIVSVSTGVRYFRTASGSPPEGLAEMLGGSRERGAWRSIVEPGSPPVARDLSKKEFEGHPLRTEYGLRFYAEAPLVTSDGDTYGVLCLLDPRPRQFDNRDATLLGAYALAVVGRLETLAASGRETISTKESARLGSELERSLGALERAEEELRKNETGSGALLEVLPDLVLRFGRDGEYLEVKAAVAGKLVLPREELLGKKIIDVLPPEVSSPLLREVSRALETGEARTHEYSLEVPEGMLDFEARLVASGPNEVVCLVHDVTGRKSAEGKLREAYQKLGLHVENSPLGVIEWDRDMRVRRWSREAENIFGWRAEEAIGRHFSELGIVHEEDEEGVVNAVMSMLLSGTERHVVFKNRNYTSEGSIVHCEWYNSVLSDEEGKLASILSLVMDVTEREEAGAALRESEERLRALTEAALEGILITRKGKIVEANRAYAEMFGYELSEMVGRPVVDFTAPESVETVLGHTRSDDEDPYEVVAYKKDGTRLYIEIHGRPSTYRDRDVRVTAIRDVTGRRMAAKALEEREERFRSLVQNASDIITILDASGIVTYGSPSIQRVLGYTPEDLIGRNTFDYIHPEDAGNMFASFTRTADSTEAGPFLEYRFLHANGSWRHLESSGNNMLEDPTIKGIIVNSRDVTERKALERQLEHQALHDGLTGLPNRTLLLDRLGHALEGAGRRKDAVALLFLDLDDFKIVNDSLGHEMGDRLLIEVAGRLRASTRAEDTVSRLGGDEFTVLIENVREPGEAILVAEKIAQALREPFTLGGHEVPISSSIGIVLSRPGHSGSPEDLLRQADTAMYSAKGKGKAAYEVFTESMDTVALERLKMGSDLKRAIERQEFEVYYQPKVSIETGEIFGVEALIRWKHPEHGLISPARFIPVAEETGLIVPIGKWVLEKACRHTRRWQNRRTSNPPLMVSVNLSAKQFEHPDLVDDIAGILRETGLDGSCLNLEITESAAMEDAEATAATLRELKDLGVSLSIDDFGTGYSSLSYLKRFPVDYLKVDRSFVDGLGRNPEDTVLISGIVSLAHALNLKVVAEGVETAEQLAILREMGCDAAQGYYFFKPLIVEDASEALREGRLA